MHLLPAGVSRLRVAAMPILLAALLAVTSFTSEPLLAAPLPDGAPERPTAAELAAVAAAKVSDSPALTDVPDPGLLAESIFALAESMPAQDWDIRALAEALEYDPIAAFEFVRDHIRYEPYRGVLRGAHGALAARGGNAADRSLLLSALLDEMLVEHEFVLGTLDDVALAAALDAARSGPPKHIDTTPPGARLDLRRVAKRARRDYAALQGTLGDRLAQSTGRDEAQSAAEARDHVWLRIPRGADVVDLDTTLASAVPGEPLARHGTAEGTLPDSLNHVIEVRVLVEQLDGGRLDERVLLERRLDSVDAPDREIFLYFQPEIEGFAGAIDAVLSGDKRWAPVLMIDGVGTAGDNFSAGGSGVDLLGDPTELPELVSLRLGVTTTGPGLDPVTAEHLLFDRRSEPALRGSLVGTDRLEPLTTLDGALLGLGGIYHIAVSNGGANPRTQAYLQAQVLDVVAGPFIDENLAANFSLADRLWPLAMADQSLVLKSEQVLVPAAGGSDGVAYVARPRVYVTSIGPSPNDPDSLVQAIDLLIDDVRILPKVAGEPNGLARLWYGVLQSSLETEAGIQRAAALEGGTRELASAAIDSAGSLRLVDPNDGPDLNGAHPALISDLEDDRLVVVARNAVEARSWWSIDPTDGTTRAMLAPGLRGVRNVVHEPAARTFDGSWAKVNLGGARRFTRPVHMRPPHLPGNYTPRRPPPRLCTSKSEYMTIIGCVSLPAAISVYGVQVIFVVTLTMITQSLWTDWLGNDE